MKCTDQNIIELIKSTSKRAENQSVMCLYKCKLGVMSVLIKMGLKEADERISCLNHAIVTFIIQVRKGKFQLTGEAKICTYLTKIAKLKWLAALKGKPLFKLLDETQLKQEENTSDSFEDLHEAINQLSATDKIIIIAFYFHKTPLEEFANAHNMTHDAAKKRLSRARKKLKEILKNRG